MTTKCIPLKMQRGKKILNKDLERQCTRINMENRIWQNPGQVELLKRRKELRETMVPSLIDICCLVLIYWA